MKRVPFVSRWVFAVAVAIASVVAPFAQTAAHAATSWHLSVGASSGDNAVQVNYFLPNEVWVNAGDSVTWTFDSTEPHTVTFLNGNARPIGFAAFDPYGPNPNTMPSGSIVSSGFAGLGSPAYTITFNDPGDYTFNCLVHPPMTGVVHVRPAGNKLPHDPAYYDQLGASIATKRLSQGGHLEDVALQSTKSGQDTAGIGLVQTDGSIAVLRFLPQNLTARVNQTLTFTNLDPQTPHTITFGPEDTGAPGFPALPYGSTTISSKTQQVSSGFIWSQPLPGFPTFGTTFSVKFTATGTYDFICALHDELGMRGSVTVTN